MKKKIYNETQACLKENSINLTCESSKSIIELLVIYFSMNERFCNFISSLFYANRARTANWREPRII
jgi:hypothetical protein